MWKDYDICDCAKNLAWAWVRLPRSECIWKKTLKSYIPDFKGFAEVLEELTGG
jgi:hypothetical protein